MTQHSDRPNVPYERYAYVEAKAPFIWETARTADEWAQATGWEPPPPMHERPLGREGVQPGASGHPVRPGDEITAEAELLDVRDDKPICRLRTLMNQDGTTVLDGTALVYQEPLARRTSTT